MKIRPALLFAVALGAVALFAAPAISAQDGPGPSAGTVLADGLRQPRGIEVGPGGDVFVAEAGSGGTTEIVVGDVTYKTGPTGRISRIDAVTGARSTVADGLLSLTGDEGGEAVGPVDIAFIGNALYYLQTAGGPDGDSPTGVYRVDNDGDTHLIANIGQFNIDNPVVDIVNGVKPDIDPGGNPNSMIALGGVLYVVDANQEQLMRITTGGDITRLAEFPGGPVTTSVAAQTSGGPFYVSTLGPGPFFPDTGTVLAVAPADGSNTKVAGGYSMLIDLEFGPGGDLLALQFNDTSEAGEEGFAPFTGKVLTVNDDGTLSPIVTGLTFATGMTYSGDTLYVSNDGINALGTGQVVKIENVTDLEPIVAAPTVALPAATPTSTTGVSAPDTGNGGYADPEGGMSVWILVAAVVSVVALGYGAAARARRG